MYTVLQISSTWTPWWSTAINQSSAQNVGNRSLTLHFWLLTLALKWWHVLSSTHALTATWSYPPLVRWRLICVCMMRSPTPCVHSPTLFAQNVVRIPLSKPSLQWTQNSLCGNNEKKEKKKCNVVFTVSKKVLPLIDCLLYSEIITLIVSAVVLLTSWYVPTRATVFSFWSCIVCVCGFCTINLTVYTHCDSVAGLCFPNQVSLYQHLFATCLHFSRCVTLKCPICRQFHPTLDVLEEHLTTFHPNQKRYQCLLCRRKYHTHFSFLHHIPQVHKNLDSRAAAEASIDDPEPPDLSFESENHNLPQNF